MTLATALVAARADAEGSSIPTVSTPALCGPQQLPSSRDPEPTRQAWTANNALTSVVPLQNSCPNVRT